MKKFFLNVLFGLTILLTSVSAQAITIGFNPVSQEVPVGTPVNVDLTISGLGDFTAPSLSTFDLDVSFNPGILSFNNVTYVDPIIGDDGISKLDEKGKLDKFKEIYASWHDTSYEREKRVGRAVKKEINIGDIIKVKLEGRMDPLYGSPIPGPIAYGFFEGNDVEREALKLKLSDGEIVWIPIGAIEKFYKYEE